MDISVVSRLKGKGKGKDRKGKDCKGKDRKRGFPDLRPGDCFKCGGANHRALDCPGDTRDAYEYEDEDEDRCWRCEGWGHRARECPTGRRRRRSDDEVVTWLDMVPDEERLPGQSFMTDAEVEHLNASLALEEDKWFTQAQGQRATVEQETAEDARDESW